MKKLYAQGYLRLSMLGVGVGCLIFLYGCYTSIKSNVKGRELLIIFGIGLILLTIYKLQMIFPYTWVKYGNGCITISRISKEKNTHEKKRKKIDIIDVTKIEKYGFSFEILKRNIECTHYKEGPLGIDMAMFILTKEQKIVPIELMYYTKTQSKCLIKYIYANTGILPSGQLNDYL